MSLFCPLATISRLLTSSPVLLFFLFILMSSNVSEAQQSVMFRQAPIRQKMDTPAWQFRQAGTTDWLPVQVPVSVHTALQQNGKIEDPFFRDNEEKLQWIEKEDWEFQANFDIDPASFSRKHIDLIFKGLDTYAQVYINDSLLLTTDNQFRTWRADAKKFLRQGRNHLHIYFESPIKKTEADWKALGYELPGGIRTMSRKAQFHYGWDWGPKFVGAGILQTPEIEAWDDVLIENIFVTTQDVTPERAKLVARIRYRSTVAMDVTLAAKFQRRVSLEDRKFEAGVHEDSVTWTVDDPKLWWPVGFGEQHLYDFAIEIKKSGLILEHREVRAGIRTVQLVTEKDGKGESFYFKVNGKPVFAKGANYIPQHIFQDQVRPEDYERLLSDAVAANMNMLRVWGGGIYEDDEFYRLCDEKGLLVWQDFMYACALYPGGGRFLKNAAREAIEQIERLRQHPSVVLWCGNNENNEAWHHWGWQMQFNEVQRAQLWRDYKMLFNELLPTYVDQFSGGVPYWESSPKYGRGNPKSISEGDAHYWGVWHDEEPFDIFNKKVPRFMSEFGFQSFPEWRTIESFTNEGDRMLESKVMLAHQKHPRGNALIAEYMKRDYHTPKKFEDFVYVSQLLQAEGMRTGLEAHRRNKPYCMGTLYWQLNDVWPVASWSSIDCFGHWKALHYYAKEAFTPLAALPMLENDRLRIYGVNDKPEADTVTLRVRTMNFDGKVLSTHVMENVILKPDSSRMIWENPYADLLQKEKPETCVTEIILEKSGLERYHRLYYSVPPKKMKLPTTDLTVEVSKTDKGIQIGILSNKLAKNVMISTSLKGRFSNNYFDILPGQKVSVMFTPNDKPSGALEFTVKTLNEID